MTGMILVREGPAGQGGCGTAAAFGSGAILALPILLAVALLRRRRHRAPRPR